MSESVAPDVDLETENDIDPGAETPYHEASAANIEALPSYEDEFNGESEEDNYGLFEEDVYPEISEEDENTEVSEEDENTELSEEDENSEMSEEYEDSEESDEYEDPEMTEEEKKREEERWKQRERDFFTFKLKPNPPDDRPLVGRELLRELALHKKMRNQVLEQIKNLRNVPYIQNMMRRNLTLQDLEESTIDVQGAFSPHPYPL